MQPAALVVVFLFSAWIAAAGVFALARPRAARAAIARFATSHRINLIEQAGRTLAGAGLVVRAPDALTPALFAWLGWFMIVSAILLAVMPLRWHTRYARWWSQNLPLWAARVGGIAALALAAGLARSALG